jgi:hypothetical protein
MGRRPDPHQALSSNQLGNGPRGRVFPGIGYCPGAEVLSDSPRPVVMVGGVLPTRRPEVDLLGRVPPAAPRRSGPPPNPQADGLRPCSGPECRCCRSGQVWNPARSPASRLVMAGGLTPRPTVAVPRAPDHSLMLSVELAGSRRVPCGSGLDRPWQSHRQDRPVGAEAGGCTRRGGRLRALPLNAGFSYPVVADQMSVLPKVAGQSASGQGAGSASCPAASDAARYRCTASQTAASRASVHTPTP